MSSEPAPVDLSAGEAARARQLQLTKPPGSLGRLEDLACWFAARLGSAVPAPPRCEIFLFAADHVLAALEDCRIEVVDVGVASEEAPPSGVRNERVRAGTRDLSSTAAMTAEE